MDNTVMTRIITTIDYTEATSHKRFISGLRKWLPEYTYVGPIILKYNGNYERTVDQIQLNKTDLIS